MEGMIRVAINGFGRIGRNVLRAALEHSKYNKKFEIIAINDLGNTNILAHLFKYDSIYGRFDGDVKANNDHITINGSEIKFLSQVNPAKLPWKDFDIDVAVESTVIVLTRSPISAVSPPDKYKFIPHFANS